MKNIVKIKCPAKINLTLEVLNKREDGYHNIKSIMQTISLYDYLTIEIDKGISNSINLSGNSEEIPYNEKNLVYKAINLFLERADITNLSVKVYIEKNIPISAGLAGGSTDGAGVLCGLNYLLKKFSEAELHNLCSQLGSDLNVCLRGGCILATSRGEVIKSLPNVKSEVSLIKPINLGISAGEAYTKFSKKAFKSQKNMTEKMIQALESREDISEFLYNDLEYAVYDDYQELQNIKNNYKDSIMTGSGSTYFVLKNLESINLGKEYQLINNLQFISDGVGIA